MNFLARLITTALIAALAFVAVPSTAQADITTAPPECEAEVAGAGSTPAGCQAPDPNAPAPECEAEVAGANNQGPAGCQPTDPDVVTADPPPAGCQTVVASAPPSDAASRSGTQILRLKSKVQQLRERLRSR